MKRYGIIKAQKPEEVMDAKFFRKLKKANRAVEYTDSEAVIPAVSGSAEIRVALPNRRPLTMDERQEAIKLRYDEISVIEEEIESERKALLQLVKNYQTDGRANDVVVQNLKIKGLIERRSKLAYPEKWIEELSGLTLKDIFESKRDTRKIGYKADVYQIKRRVEPITSLYVDLSAAAAQATLAAEEKEAATATEVAAAAAAETASATAKAIAATVTAGTDALASAAAATRGAIIGQRRTIKLKKPTLS
jgi:hypothetical protein